MISWQNWLLLLLDVIGLIGVINAIDISDVIENVGDIDVLTCRHIRAIVSQSDYNTDIVGVTVIILIKID